MKKTLIQTHVAFFFKKGDRLGKNIDEIAYKLRDKLKPEGSPEVNFNPVFEGMPDNVNIPIVSFVFSKFNIGLAKNRLDVYFKNKDNDIDSDYILKISGNVFEFIKEDINFNIGRIGFVKDILINEFDDGGVKELEKALNKDLISGAEVREINLRINIREEILGFKCNNIEKIEPDFKGAGSFDNPSLKLQKDINTINEDSDENNFDDRDLVIKLIEGFNIKSDRSVFIK